MEERHTGTVVDFARGYGFIECPRLGPSRQRVFVHRADLVLEFGTTVATLVEGQKVSFEIWEEAKGKYRALRVMDFKGMPLSCVKDKKIPSVDAVVQRRSGVVCMWGAGKPFGFIDGADGVKYFAASRDVVMEGRKKCLQLNLGQKVEFDVAPAAVEDKGPRACRVSGPHLTGLLNGTIVAAKPVARKPAPKKKKTSKDDDDDFEDEYQYSEEEVYEKAKDGDDEDFWTTS